MAATVTSTLAGDMAMALDPVILARAAGYPDLDPWQAALLRSPAKQIILNVSRQAGKSSMTSILALHDILFRPPALVLVLSPSQRQSSLLFNKIKKAYFAVTGGTAKQDSATSLELSNGSQLVSLPGSEATVRGFSSVTRLICDEASRIPDELYQAVRPMLAVSGGSIALLSTPWGRRGFFFKEWAEGGPEWERYEIPATLCPRIDPAWLAAERRQIGDFIYMQEYACTFIETEDSVFRYEDIKNMANPELKPLFAEDEAISYDDTDNDNKNEQW